MYKSFKHKQIELNREYMYKFFKHKHKLNKNTKIYIYKNLIQHIITKRIHTQSCIKIKIKKHTTRTK